MLRTEGSTRGRPELKPADGSWRETKLHSSRGRLEVPLRAVDSTGATSDFGPSANRIRYGQPLFPVCHRASGSFPSALDQRRSNPLLPESNRRTEAGMKTGLMVAL